MFRILHLTTGKYLSCFYCPHTSFFFGLNPNKEVKKQYIAMIDKLKERKEVEIMYHNENTWIRSFFSPDEFELVEM